MTVAMTAAAPPMSDFIHSIAAAGLSDRPPESNVMPLPTSARCGALRPPRLVAEPHQPRRARRALADAEDAAVPGLLQRLLVEHLDGHAGGLGGSDGAVREHRGRQVGRRGVDQVARAVHGLDDGVGACDARLGVLVPRQVRAERERLHRRPVAVRARSPGTRGRRTRRAGRPRRRPSPPRRWPRGGRARPSRCRPACGRQHRLRGGAPRGRTDGRSPRLVTLALPTQTATTTAALVAPSEDSLVTSLG